MADGSLRHNFVRMSPRRRGPKPMFQDYSRRLFRIPCLDPRLRGDTRDKNELDRPDPVVLGVMFQLDQAQALQHRGDIVGEPAAIALTQTIIATDRIILRPRPGLQRTGPSPGLLSSSALPSSIQPPWAFNMATRVLDGAQPIGQLGGAHLAVQAVVRLIAPGLELGGLRRGFHELPGIVRRAGVSAGINGHGRVLIDGRPGSAL